MCGTTRVSSAKREKARDLTDPHTTCLLFDCVHATAHLPYLLPRVYLLLLLMSRCSPGRSPMYLAIESFNSALANFLLDRGADGLAPAVEVESSLVRVSPEVLAAAPQTRRTGSLLFYAAMHALGDIAERLIAMGADPNEEIGIELFPDGPTTPLQLLREKGFAMEAYEKARRLE